MKVLVIGSGGREHALVWKLKQSPRVEKLYCAPGNAGTAMHAENIPVKSSDIGQLIKFAERETIDLTVVGSEQPLAEGIVDQFEAKGLRVFGPSKAAAQLESSKVFAKQFMVRHGIPTARFGSFSGQQVREAGAFIASLRPPIVVKADGLAAGKGVIIAQSHQEAELALDECFEKRSFGEAGDHVVIEEFLDGEEVSVFALTDGERCALLAPAQDHKRILDGDLGKNTGGMGAYAPAPIATSALLAQVERDIVRPTLAGMSAEGMAFRGCLFVGLMITADGPKVLEYNCRFGDPETQVVVPLIDGDLAEIFLTVAQRKLDPAIVKRHPASAVCVVVASQGYPDRYEVGKPISGLERVQPDEGTVVFHAGTALDRGNVVTTGGRVLGVTAIGFEEKLEQTIAHAYRAVRSVTFDGAYYRSDIGKRALLYQERVQ